MPEYIEREAAIRRLSLGVFIGEDPVKFLKKVPAADVEPVRHGRWKYRQGTRHTKAGFFCSDCNGPLWFSPDVPQAFKYCPTCGAKMDETT